MTDQQHPITPSPELVEQWRQEHTTNYDLARQAARWGAEQELEACITWVAIESLEAAKELRAARRPKPPSLKEQALEAQQRMWDGGVTREDWELVRRALEQLDD